MVFEVSQPQGSAGERDSEDSVRQRRVDPRAVAAFEKRSGVRPQTYSSS